MNLGLIAEGLLIALLLTALIGAWRAQKALANFHQDRLAMEKMVNDYTRAITLAEEAGKALQITVKHSTSHLEKAIIEAGKHKDDLEFLTDKAKASLDDLETGLEQVRKAKADLATLAMTIAKGKHDQASVLSGKAHAPAKTTGRRSKAEEDLYAALLNQGSE